MLPRHAATARARHDDIAAGTALYTRERPFTTLQVIVLVSRRLRTAFATIRRQPRYATIDTMLSVATPCRHTPRHLATYAITLRRMLRRYADGDDAADF